MNHEDVPLLAKLADNVCLSGGAAGADVAWGNEAIKAGHQVIHWSFEGHKSQDPANSYILTQEELDEANDYLREANLTLKRRLDFNKFYIKLLQRNWYQVKYADTVFAIGTLNEKAVFYDHKKGAQIGYHITNDRKDRMGINGGTAWACQMYLDRYRRELGNMNFRLVFYEQDKLEILFYSPREGYWIPWAEATRFATSVNTGLLAPSGIYAAIGTRDLKPNGKAYIERMFQRTP